MEIVKPENKYLQSYYEACVETWGHVHDNYIIHNPNEYNNWKEHIFEDYEKNEKGIDLPDGFVPSVTFWVIENEEYIGTINIRPLLNDRLKEYGGHIGFVVRQKYRQRGYGKQIATLSINLIRQMGIKEILLTCEKTNIPSQRILEKLNPSRVKNDIVILNGKYTKIQRYYFR